MQATLYIIGVGPGDPDLLTIKALNVLRRCPVIATPKATQNGHSTALSIVQQALPVAETHEKEIMELHFPMKKIQLGQEPDPEVLQAWQYAAGKIFAILSQGRDVAFPTLGDPAIYSTGYYLYATILEMHPEVRVQFVPGISAMSSCSATTHTPICLGILETFDTIVLMKVHRVMDHLISLLNDLNLLDKAALVERVGMEDERVIGDLSVLAGQTGQVHYFSTIIVRKK